MPDRSGPMAAAERVWPEAMARFREIEQGERWSEDDPPGRPVAVCMQRGAEGEMGLGIRLR